jgi:uncharacterized protein YndB with AHSA1/START domain
MVASTRKLLRGAALTAAWALLGRMARRSGATDAEFYGSLPGDEVLPHPMVEWTRATTIAAPADAVWPWLVQMGYHRAGWYTNERIDHLVWRVDNPNAEEILPQFQQLEVGDVVPDGPDYAAFFRVLTVERPHALVYRSIRHLYRGHPVNAADPEALAQVERDLLAGGTYIDFTWAFALRDDGNGTTRLIIRTRANAAPRWAIALLRAPLGLVDWFHVATMFRGIRRRAEESRRLGTAG